MGRYGLHECGLGRGPMMGSCEHGNKVSVPIKYSDILEWLSDWRLHGVSHTPMYARSERNIIKRTPSPPPKL